METIFIIIAVIAIFVVSTYIRYRLTAKANLIISSLGFIFLIMMFVKAKDRFTTPSLIFFGVIAIIYLVTIYFRYKKLNTRANK